MPVGFGAGMTSPFAGTGVGSMQGGRVVSRTSRPVLGRAKARKEQEQLTSSFQTQQQQARASAEKRYSNLLKRFKGVKSGVRRKQQQALGQLTNLGATATQDIERRTQQAQASATQGLISRGLGGTTITETTRRGMASDQERALLGVQELVGRQKSGLLQQQAGQVESVGRLGIDTALSRQDIAPNMSVYLQLIQQLSSLGNL